MALPQCAVLALRAPQALLDLGWTWLPGFDEQGGLLPDGCAAQVESLAQLRTRFAALLQTLQDSHGWARRDVYVLGFSQGGTVALDLALNVAPPALGGVVSVSGGPFACHAEATPRTGTGGSADQEVTPLLLTLGARDGRVPPRRAAAALAALQRKHPTATKGWECKTFPRGHCMIDSEQEMRSVMELLDSRFRLRNIAMEEHPDVRTEWT